MISNIDTVESAEWSRLRAHLRDLDYTTAKVRQLLKIADPVEEILSNVARFSLLHLRKLESCKVAPAVLARLFLFSGSVLQHDLNLLPRDLLNLLRELELINPAAGDRKPVRGTVSLTEYAGKYFLSDLLFENHDEEFIVRTDATLCMPPHASSFELLQVLKSPTEAPSFLDVGCGTGCLSILSADNCAHVDGFDLNPRPVMFARANARLNEFSGHYTVSGWEAFAAGQRKYSRIAFNAPNSDMAMEFLATKAEELLTDDGVAHVYLTCEVLKGDGDVHGAIERRVSGRSSLRFDVAINASSPFSLSAAHVRAQVLPSNSLVVPTPSQKASFFRKLADAGVVEMVSATVSARR